MPAPSKSVNQQKRSQDISPTIILKKRSHFTGIQKPRKTKENRRFQETVENLNSFYPITYFYFDTTKKQLNFMKFINNRKILFGSLGLVVSLFGINASGAIAQQGQSLQNLPDGNYAYKEVATSSSRLDTSRYFLFRKAGASVTGYHFQPRTDWTYCFKGQLQGLSLVNITMAEPKFGRGLSGFDFTQAKPEDLRNYQQVNLSKVFSTYTKLNQSLQKCLNLFPLPSNPKISNSIPSVPASSKPVKLTNLGDGYLTNPEMQRLAQEFEQNIIPYMRRFRDIGLGERSRKLDAFVRDWSKVDPEVAHFLGSWNKTVSDFMIYPSSTKGRACVVFTLPSRPSGKLDAFFAIASISNGYLQLKTNGWNNNFLGSGAALIRNGNYLGIASISQGKPDIYPQSAFSDPLRPITSLPLANTAQNQRVIQQFSAAGCTASLPSQVKPNR